MRVQCQCSGPICVILFLLSVAPHTANADLYVTYVRTIEWLTDNSDVIVIVSGDDNDPNVQHVFKGDPETVSLKQVSAEHDGYTYLSLRAEGQSRLLFIRGRHELLQEIGLARNQITGKMPPLLRVLYGVTQHGEFITYESGLFKCVEDRIRSGPGTPLPQLRSQPNARRSGVAARTDFPLETSDNIYVLIVPFTVERRDHYLKDLRTGDAITRIRALFQLSQFEDSTSREAIRSATTIQNVRPSPWRTTHAGLTTLTAEDVAEAAQAALKSETYQSP